MIKYANGEKEVFTDTPSAEEQKTSVQTEMQHREKQRRDSIIARRAEERERENVGGFEREAQHPRRAKEQNRREEKPVGNLE